MKRSSSGCNVSAIRRRIAMLDPPDHIDNIDVRFGKDSDGEPAVWIDVVVDDESDETVTSLVRFATRVQLALLSDYQEAWPYVRFRTAS
jgi:hypothetical protein